MCAFFCPVLVLIKGRGLGRVEWDGTTERLIHLCVSRKRLEKQIQDMQAESESKKMEVRLKPSLCLFPLLKGCIRSSSSKTSCSKPRNSELAAVKRYG